MAELWFRDWDHFRDATESERAEGAEQCRRFGDWIEPITDLMFTTENLIVDSPVPDEHCKWVAFVQKKDEVSRDELFAAWNDEHSPRVKISIAVTEGACFKYTTSHANQGQDGRWMGSRRSGTRTRQPPASARRQASRKGRRTRSRG